MSAARLVALAGVSGAGKDVAASHLASRHSFQRVALADPLKEVMMALFGLTREQLWGELRNTPDPRLGKAPRELYQRFGRACREIDAEVWVRIFRERVEGLLRAGANVVCTDVRTVPELRAVRELGGSAWLLRRPGAGAPGAMGLDPTETELPDLGDECFDAVVWNDGDPKQLFQRLDLLIFGATGQ